MLMDAYNIQSTLYTEYNLSQFGWYLRWKRITVWLLIPIFLVLPWAQPFGLVDGQEAPTPVRALISVCGLTVLGLSLVLHRYQRMLYDGAIRQDDSRFRLGLGRLMTVYQVLYRLLWALPVATVAGVLYLWSISLLDALELLIWGGIVFAVGRPFFRRAHVHASQWLEGLNEEDPAAWIAPRPERLRIFTLLFLIGHIMMIPLLFRWIVFSESWILMFPFLGYIASSILTQVMNRRFIGRLSIAMRRAHRLQKEARLAIVD